jgi:hypothetical protein
MAEWPPDHPDPITTTNPNPNLKTSKNSKIGLNNSQNSPQKKNKDNLEAQSLGSHFKLFSMAENLKSLQLLTKKNYNTGWVSSHMPGPYPSEADLYPQQKLGSEQKSEEKSPQVKWSSSDDTEKMGLKIELNKMKDRVKGLQMKIGKLEGIVEIGLAAKMASDQEISLLREREVEYKNQMVLLNYQN